MFPSHSKRLLLICGKGGVGKTTLACALALYWARSGERVLLAGIHSTDQLSHYFAVPTVGQRPVEVEPDLFAIHLDEQLIFDSYIRRTFRLKAIYRRILESAAYQYFTAAAPGIKELIVLDTIAAFSRGTNPRYERILIDAPATGHGVSYFGVGKQALSTFPIGPLRRMAEEIQALLTDEKQTGALLVTLAEEMPVTETIELYRSLREQLDIAVDAVLVNALLPLPSVPLRQEPLERLRDAAAVFAAPDLARRFAAAGLFYHARSQIQQHHLERLARELPVPRHAIPFLPSEARDVRFLEEICQHLGLTAVREA